MKYLSLDLEATGLEEHDRIIEIAFVPVDATTKKINESLKLHRYIACPSFEELRPSLNEWVIENNRELIEKAHREGTPIEAFKLEFENYLNSNAVKAFFGENEKIVLFGKSLNAIDLPFMNRDLGWEFMRKYFHHQVLDVSCVTRGAVDAGKLPPTTVSGSKLMEYFNMGDVAHTALEDAVNTAKLYFKILDKLS